LAVGFRAAEAGRGVVPIDVGYGKERTAWCKRCVLHIRAVLVQKNQRARRMFSLLAGDSGAFIL